MFDPTPPGELNWISVNLPSELSPVQSLAGKTCIKRDTDAGAAGAGAGAGADDDDDDDVTSSINQQSNSVNRFQVLLQHDG